MKIVDFAEERQEKADTIRKYISRHKEEFEGHTSFQGNKMEVDEVAIELLNKVYPLPRPIEIIEDTESRKKLIQAQQIIIQLQEQLKEQAMLSAKAEATQMLLEDKEQQIQELKRQTDERIKDKEVLIEEIRKSVEARETELHSKTEELNKAQEEIFELQRMLEEEKNKKWWEFWK